MQITRKRGDTYPDEFTVINPVTGAPANITGCAFKLTVNTARNPQDATGQLYQVEGEITSGQNGVVQFSPTDEQVDRVGYFYFDIEMVDTFGKKHTLVKDRYIYEQDITK